jgi:hypothetical protein
MLVQSAVSDQFMKPEMQYDFRSTGPHCYTTSLLYRIIVPLFTVD